MQNFELGYEREVGMTQSVQENTLLVIFNTDRRCNFFRWADELNQFSETRPQHTMMSIGDLLQETSSVTSTVQLAAWSHLKQGSDQWHQRGRMCACTSII